MVATPDLSWASSSAEYLDHRVVAPEYLVGLFLCTLTLAAMWSIVFNTQQGGHHPCVICLDDDSNAARPCCPRCTVSMCTACQLDYHTFRRSRSCPVCGSKLVVPTRQADGIDPEQEYRMWFGLMLGRLERLVVAINTGDPESERCRRLAAKLVKILERNRRALLHPGSALREVAKLQFAGLAAEYPWGPEMQRRVLSLIAETRS